MTNTVDTTEETRIAIGAYGLEKTLSIPSVVWSRPFEASTWIARSARSTACSGPMARARQPRYACSRPSSPHCGRAEIDGVDVVTNPLEVRRRLGFLSTSTGLYPRLTPRETLRYFGGLHGLDESVIATRIEELIETFDMGEFARRPLRGLSTGQKQKVSIARAVLHDPPVLILDEPTTGLDVLASSAMIEFVESRRTSGTCVLFSTHVLSEAERLCDRIGIIDHGRLLASGTADELREQTGERWLEDVFKVFVARAGETRAE